MNSPADDPIKYNPSELLICTAARLMPDNTTAFIGTGIPMLAASLAQKMHRPEPGDRLRIRRHGGDPGRAAHGSRRRVHFPPGHRGRRHPGYDRGRPARFHRVRFPGRGADRPVRQPEQHRHRIDHDHPKVRLPGSGGGNDVGSHCWQTIAIMRHDRKRFVEKLDFITTPGYLTGAGSREAAGLPPGTGPYRVVSNLGVMGFHPESKRMMLLATQPGVKLEQVIENTGFELLIADHVEEESTSKPR